MKDARFGRGGPRSGNEEEGSLQAGNQTFLRGSSTSSSDHRSHKRSGDVSSVIRGVTIKSTSLSKSSGT